MFYKEYHVRILYQQDDDRVAPEDIYDDWENLLLSVNSIDKALQNWFFPALITTKSAEYKNVFSEKEKIITHANKKRGKPASKNPKLKGIMYTAWSQKVPVNGMTKEEESFFSKSFMSGGFENTSSLFSLSIRNMYDSSPEDTWDKYVKIIKSLCQKKKPIWVDVYPEGYMEHAAFEHRKPVGWMAVVPDVNIVGDIPFIAHEEYIENTGTLLVTTKEPFDVFNNKHIEAGQATEIALMDRGLLPPGGRQIA